MKKRYILILILTVFLALSISACELSDITKNSTTTDGDNTSNTTVLTTLTDTEDPNANISISIDDSTYTGEEATSDFTIETSDGTYSKTDYGYEITSAGTYTLSGCLEGYIYVNATEDDKIELDLSNATIVSNENSPIYIYSSGDIKVKSVKETYNVITDNRQTKTSDSTTQGEGAIYAKADLKIVGQGTLVVTGNYNNGIHTTKDLTVKNTTLKVTAVNNALKGNNSVTIEENPTILLVSSSDGIKTSESGVTSKGKQKGTVTITGGIVNIYSYENGIDAAYDVVISKGSYKDDDGVKQTTNPVVTIYTNKYASEEADFSSSTTMYLRLDSSLYKTSYKYVLHFFSGEETDISGVWVDASYDKSVRTGGNSGRPGYSSTSNTYYFYKVAQPSDYSYFKVYVFASDATTYSISTAKYSSKDGFTVNTQKDTIALSLSNDVITSSGWTSYTQSTSQQGGFSWGGMQGGNTNVAETTAKGIKADNEITISSGALTIKAYDDGLHANYGETLENGEKGTGIITISGGTLNIYASDDAIHADNTLNITGGEINITNSYEGLEANIINVSGGTTYIYATDDGINASKKINLTPEVNVSGGILDITISGGDVDGIDSNGNFTQSGGIVITRGGTNGSNMSTGLDVDGTAKITGGLFICFGRPEKTPTASSGVSTYTLSGTYTNKTYTFSYTGGSISTTNQLSSYQGVYVWSALGKVTVS